MFVLKSVIKHSPDNTETSFESNFIKIAHNNGEISIGFMKRKQSARIDIFLFNNDNISYTVEATRPEKSKTLAEKNQ